MTAAADPGLPLAGVRVLALEQMISLPFATQLLGRLGATVVKVENPNGGDLGRGSLPAVCDPQGRRVGVTFTRYNHSKRSVCIDLKAPGARDLVLRLAKRFDVVAENFKGGVLESMGLGYEDFRAVHPGVVHLSISGFGKTTDSPYRAWPAYAAVAEAMSGLYDWYRPRDEPPTINPAGALGDTASGLFGVVGVLAALFQRERTGLGQHVDIAMFDAMVAMFDLPASYVSLGEEAPHGRSQFMILDGFEAADGWFVLQVGREADFAKLCGLLGRPDWLHDGRFSTRIGWRENIEVIRDEVNRWAAAMTSVEACHALAAAGLAAGPCFTAEQVLADPHLAERRMLVATERVDGVSGPVISPGNPVKLSVAGEADDSRFPWLGEHTDEVLRVELGCTDDELAEWRQAGVIV